MRRCPHCESPNPERASFCAACGRSLPALPREAFFRLQDVWQPRALRRAWQAVAVLMLFRLSAGSLLTVGALRLESRFLAFHLMHGFLLGAGVAWVRGERRLRPWLLWLAAGLAGGLLAESLEVWYTYRHLMDTLTLYAWDWFGLPTRPSLVYQILQGLRILGALTPLFLLAVAGERRIFRSLTAFFLCSLAVALRVPVRGAFLSWAGLGALLGLSWQHSLLYAASAYCLFYGLGARALTPEDQKP